MQLRSFDDFDLVGGTSLALQIGHRNSVDIDLFGESQLEMDEILVLLPTVGELITIKKSSKILITSINNIKVDFVNYSYPILEKASTVGGIRLASTKDIAAMKLNAIAGRGSKKDFIDLYFLLSIHSFPEMLDFYKRKYQDGSIFMVLKSLTYFDDADKDTQPKMFLPFNWDDCKEKIKLEVGNFFGG
jgi:hypothetical protein